MNFSLHHPDSFSGAYPSYGLFVFVPQFLCFIKVFCVLYSLLAYSNVKKNRNSPLKMQMQFTITSVGRFSISSHLSFSDITQALD